MALFQFKSKGVTRKLVDLVYPVGSLYFSTNSTNPSTLFGGTWQPYGQGRTIIGAGTGNDGSTSMSFTATSTGGKYKTSITEQNLSGNVTISRQTNAYGSHAKWEQFTPNGWAVDALRDTGDPVGQPVDILQPYIVTNIWIRVS